MPLGKGWQYGVGAWLRDELRQISKGDLSPLAIDLPGTGVMGVEGRADHEVVIIIWQDKPPEFVSAFGELKQEEFETIKAASSSQRTFSELYGNDKLKAYYSEKSLLIVADMIAEDAWNDNQVEDQCTDWFNHVCLPAAEKLNQARVERAIPKPPSWDANAISDSCWVIESDEGFSQGTGFLLSGVGVVTCAHVVVDQEGRVHQDLRLYHPSAPHRHHDASPLLIDRALDVAVLDPSAISGPGLIRAADDDQPLHAHVAVCGYPNFAPGKGCHISPGYIVNHQMKSAVRRSLTNAGIVTGMSGGPAVSHSNEVVGICVTGADEFGHLPVTDDQGILPISVLDIAADR